jgi:DNA polymerase-4
LASGIKKPDGIFEITPQNRDEVLFTCKLTDVCGLGDRLEKRLFNLGITNFKNLREIPIEYLEASLGPYWPKELKKLSYGVDDSILTRVSQIPKMKSVSRTFTLYENVSDLNKIKATLRNLCEEVGFKVRQMGQSGRIVGLGVGGAGYSRECTHKTFKYFLDTGEEIFKVAWNLFERLNWQKEPLNGYVRFLGVWLGDLESKSELTVSLLPQEKKKDNLITAVDQVNKRFGELTLYPAVMLNSGLIKSEVTGFLGDKGFRFGNFC